MRRSIFCFLILLATLALPARAQRGIEMNQPSAPPRAEAVQAADNAAAPTKPDARSKPRKNSAPSSGPDVNAGALPTSNVRWCGHAFVYITSSTGVRVAIDPFGPDKVKYLFPARLPADVILISSEGEDHSAAERLFGAPQVFRSVTAVGINRANGSLFKGVEVFKDSRRGVGANYSTAFVFTLDGVTFAHLGVVGDVLDFKQRGEIGAIDVLFLPVGNPMISVADLNKIATDLKAKIIVPIAYRTASTGAMDLRSVDDFLVNQPNTVKRVDAIEFPVNTALLPEKPTIYVLNIP